MVANTRVFSTFLPRTKYSFAFSKIYLPIFPGICALFLCLLFSCANIYIRGYLLFQNIFEKYFSKLRAKFRFRSILGEIFEKEKKIIREISKKSEKLDSLFFEKKSRFKSIFDVKSSGNAKNHRSRALWRMEKLALLLLFRGSRKKERKKREEKKRKNIRDPNAWISFYSPVSRSDRVISCSGWQSRARRGIRIPFFSRLENSRKNRLIKFVSSEHLNRAGKSIFPAETKVK